MRLDIKKEFREKDNETQVSKEGFGFPGDAEEEPSRVRQGDAEWNAPKVVGGPKPPPNEGNKHNFACYHFNIPPQTVSK